MCVYDCICVWEHLYIGKSMWSSWLSNRRFRFSGSLLVWHMGFREKEHLWILCATKTPILDNLNRAPRTWRQIMMCRCFYSQHLKWSCVCLTKKMGPRGRKTRHREPHLLQDPVWFIQGAVAVVVNVSSASDQPKIPHIFCQFQVPALLPHSFSHCSSPHTFIV